MSYSVCRAAISKILNLPIELFFENTITKIRELLIIFSYQGFTGRKPWYGKQVSHGIVRRMRAREENEL